MAESHARRKVDWDPDMLATLRELRGRGVPLYQCAEAIGVGYSTAAYKARELGIAARLNRGRQPGTEVLGRC
jgi:hypothetical protein